MRNKDTKLWLTEEEIKLFENTSFFKAKQALTTHLTDILEHTRDFYWDQSSSMIGKLPAESMINQGKISKGENYQGLPYLVLDFPAVFKKDGVFAFRTILWWGHPASITFHISGTYLNMIPDSHPGLTGNNLSDELMICVNKNQWEHHHEVDNYIPLQRFNRDHQKIKKHAVENGFLKVMLKIPIENIQLLPEKGSAFISLITKDLK